VPHHYTYSHHFPISFVWGRRKKRKSEEERRREKKKKEEK
jgi:hypothetical protein